MSKPLVPATPLRVLVLLTSPRVGRSEAGALAVAAQLRARGVAVDLARQTSLPLVAAGLALDDYPLQILDLLQRAGAADMLVLAGPVHRSQISGVMRNAIELLRDQLENKPVAVSVGVGSARAQLAADNLRADLYLNFRSVPVGALVVSDQLSQHELDGRAATLADCLLSAVPLPA